MAISAVALLSAVLGGIGPLSSCDPRRGQHCQFTPTQLVPAGSSPQAASEHDAPVEWVRVSTPGSANCSLEWHEQTLDHFGFAPTEPATFKQRIFIHDEWWKPGGPIFFYCGEK